ncbi:glycosyltransferase family 9 protein (plasmid) [Pedobacter sp. BS3]|uniref:glycosyltransferase family 9 protein n=1 Tax=Pedobacter sp. BS3 TaxID=2567937 RepID=UPI0011EBBBE5|nr:glycosyltransferase family 9 protein [Pedobacter sp. BS3]TZF86014.1 glycosyltransferase family 9 protein [Pedobacter sp. BS3]
MKIENRNSFRISRFILLKLPFILRFLAFLRPKHKRLLLIKTDEIGDYILFRNYIAILKQSQKFKDYEIDLLGNTVWRDLVTVYDREYLSAVFFIQADKIYDKPMKCLAIGWQLFKRNYTIVLQPTYSRTLMIDGMAALTAAKTIIGFQSDNERILPKYKRKTDKFYSSKLQLPAHIHFEFERSKYFIERVTGQPADIDKPWLPVKAQRGNYIVLFPGAGYAGREWGTTNFIALAKRILQQTGLSLVIAGGKQDIHHAENMLSELSLERVSSKVAQTTLPELIELIAGAACIITNDTSAVHIAAACNTPVLCIHGVAHYQRFIPYPEHLAANMKFVYTLLPCFNCNWNCIYPLKENETYPCVAINTVDQVWQAFNELIYTQS